jgi:hypothetical protein
MKTKHHSTPPSTKSCRRKVATYRFDAAFGSFVGLVLFTLSPYVARAECSNWDVTGTWEVKQSNGSSITVVVAPKGGGSFEVTSPTGGGGLGSGNISGNDFFMEIGWYGGTNDGVYRGKVGSSGRISGTTYDANNPGSKARWFSAKVMKCADAAPAAAATPKPLRATGKARPAAADEWIDQELRKRKTATQPTPSASNRPRGFINGLQLPTPTPSPEADEYASDDQHKKKKKKHHHHHDRDDDQNQGND